MGVCQSSCGSSGVGQKNLEKNPWEGARVAPGRGLASSLRPHSSPPQSSLRPNFVALRGGPSVSPETSSPFMILKLKILQQLHGSRAGRFQNEALALAPRTSVLNVCNSYSDGGRLVFKMGLSPWRRAHSFEQFAIVTRMEWGSFSTFGFRLRLPSV